MAPLTDFRAQQWHDTFANLTSNNDTPEDGEIVFETDTGKMKIGRGSTAYNDLAYFTGAFVVSSEYLDTTSGDEAATFPGSPNTGDVHKVYNIGTGGNHATTSVNGINIGDGKGVWFEYTGSVWRYEDVPIDEYIDTGTANIEQTIIKWSGGRMVNSSYLNSGAAQQAITFFEAFTSFSTMLATSASNGSMCVPLTPTITGCNTSCILHTGVADNGDRNLVA